MSGRDNLQLHCEYMGYYVPGSVDHALDMLGLQEAGNQLVKRYSLGMKQRLGIARAILCRPELLVLDVKWSMVLIVYCVHSVQKKREKRTLYTN